MARIHVTERNRLLPPFVNLFRVFILDRHERQWTWKYGYFNGILDKGMVQFMHAFESILT